MAIYGENGEFDILDKIYDMRYLLNIFSKGFTFLKFKLKNG